MRDDGTHYRNYNDFGFIGWGGLNCYLRLRYDRAYLVQEQVSPHKNRTIVVNLHIPTFGYTLSLKYMYGEFSNFAKMETTLILIFAKSKIN